MISTDPEHVHVTRPSRTQAPVLVDGSFFPEDVDTVPTEPVEPFPSTAGRAVRASDEWARARHYPGEFLG